MPRYIIVPEANPFVEGEQSLCEWDTFLKGQFCNKPFTKAIVEGNFHWAHLCDEHADLGLAELNDEEEEKWAKDIPWGKSF